MECTKKDLMDQKQGRAHHHFHKDKTGPSDVYRMSIQSQVWLIHWRLNQLGLKILGGLREEENIYVLREECQWNTHREQKKRRKKDMEKRLNIFEFSFDLTYRLNLSIHKVSICGISIQELMDVELIHPGNSMGVDFCIKRKQLKG